MLIIIFATVLLLAFLKISAVDKRAESVIDAIYSYRMWCIKNHVEPEVEFDDVIITNNIYDILKCRGYDAIISNEKYEVIKNFMEEK